MVLSNEISLESNYISENEVRLQDMLWQKKYSCLISIYHSKIFTFVYTRLVFILPVSDTDEERPYVISLGLVFILQVSDTDEERP